MISESYVEPHHWAIFRETSETPGATPLSESPSTAAATTPPIAEPWPLKSRSCGSDMSAATSASPKPKPSTSLQSCGFSVVVKSATAVTLPLSSSCV